MEMPRSSSIYRKAPGPTWLWRPRNLRFPQRTREIAKGPLGPRNPLDGFKSGANESVTSCVLALVLVYALGAEWLGGAAGITGAYLLGYVFAESKFKGDIERTFYALGHGLLIPLFFVSIGLTSNFRELGGHWLLLGVIFFIAVVSKMFGCGLAAMARGMGWVPSLRIGCGMVSRGEVGLIVAAMAVRAKVFNPSEVAMIVAVVLLTTLLTPLTLRGAYRLKCPEDEDLSGGMDEFVEPFQQPRAVEVERENSGQLLSAMLP